MGATLGACCAFRVHAFRIVDGPATGGDAVNAPSSVLMNLLASAGVRSPVDVELSTGF